MNTIKTLLFLTLACVASATEVRFKMADITGRTNDLPLSVQGMVMPFGSSNYVVAGFPIRLQPVGGTVTTNLVPGTYRLTVIGPSPLQTVDFSVTNSASVLDVRDLASFSLSKFSASQYLTTDQSDAKYALKGEVGAAGESVAIGLDAAATPISPSGFLSLIPTNGWRAYVHPGLIVRSTLTNWSGPQYSYLLSIGCGPTNPAAASEDREVPCLFGSHDGISYAPIGPQPIASRADYVAMAGYGSGWVADNHTYLDESSGILRVLASVYSSTTLTAPFYSAIVCSSTSDGTNWTHALLKTNICANGGGLTNFATFAGPQIVNLADGTLRLYFVDDGTATGGTNVLKYVAGLDTSGTNWDWGTIVSCTLPTYADARYVPWHFSMAQVGGIHHIIYGSQSASQGDYSTSTDGMTWAASGAGVFGRLNIFNTNANSVYMSSLHPVPGEGFGGVAWNGIVGLNPTVAGNWPGWQLYPMRGLKIDPQQLGYLSSKTNWTLIGTDPYYGFNNAARPAAVTIFERMAANDPITLTLGGLGSGYAGLGGNAGTLAFTNYRIAVGTSDLILNAAAGNRITWRQAHAAMGGMSTAGGLFVGSTDTTPGVGTIHGTNHVALGSGQFIGNGRSLTNLLVTGDQTNLILHGDTTIYWGGTNFVFRATTDSPGYVMAAGIWEMHQVAATNFTGNGIGLTNVQNVLLTNRPTNTIFGSLIINNSLAPAAQGTVDIVNNSVDVPESSSLTSTRLVVLASNTPSVGHRVIDGGFHLNASGYSLGEAGGTYGGLYVRDTVGGGSLTLGTGLKAYVEIDGAATATTLAAVRASLVIRTQSIATNLCFFQGVATHEGGSVPNFFGVEIPDVPATNGYGIRIAQSARPNNWGVYVAGTAGNYFAGPTLFGSTADRTNGAIQLPATTTSASAGIGFGADVNLYRSANNTLATDSILSVGGGGASTHAMALGSTNSSGVLRLRRKSDGNLTGQIGFVNITNTGIVALLHSGNAGEVMLQGDNSANNGFVTLYGGTNEYVRVKSDGVYVKTNLYVKNDMVVTNTITASNVVASTTVTATNFTIVLTNRTGSNSVAGQIVEMAHDYDFAVHTCDAGSKESIGVVLDGGIANGAPLRIVTSGLAPVLLETNITAVGRSYWIAVSDTQPGRAQALTSYNAANHDQEVGHSAVTNSYSAGPNNTVLTLIHIGR